MALIKKKAKKADQPNLKLAKSDKEKAAPKRGRGRPAGSKNKATKTAHKTTAKKAQPNPSTRQENATKAEPFANNNEIFEAAMQSNTQSTEMVKKMGEDMMALTNKNMSETAELSRELFSCRTLSDMFEVQNKMMKNNLDNFFKQSSKMSEMLFQAAGKTGAPLNTAFTDMADQMNKKFSGK